MQKYTYNTYKICVCIHTYIAYIYINNVINGGREE